MLAQRGEFYEERELWVAAQKRADEEHAKWTTEQASFRDTIAAEALASEDGDHAERARLARLVREVMYDEKRLDLLYVQVAEGDERWLLECEALEAVYALQSTLDTERLGILHHDRVRIDSEVRRELSTLHPAVAALEAELKQHSAKLDHWNGEELRLDFSPNPTMRSACVSPPTRSLSAMSQEDTRHAERERWAEQRALLKEKLRKKGRRSDPLSLTIEGGVDAVATEGERLPPVTVQVAGMPDVPVSLWGRPPLVLQGETVKLLTNGTAVFDRVYVQNCPAASGEVYVCYPRVAALQATVASVTVKLRSSLEFNVWAHRVPFVSYQSVAATSLLYDDVSSLVRREEALTLSDITAAATVVTPAGERLGAFGGAAGIKVAYHTGETWDVTITLRISDTSRTDTVLAVEFHPHFIIALTREAGVLLWERKLVNTWRGHTTSLPTTTIRHRVTSLDRLVPGLPHVPVTCVAVDGDRDEHTEVVIGGANIVAWWHNGKSVKSYTFADTERVVAVHCFDGDVYVALATRVVKLSFESSEHPSELTVFTASEEEDVHITCLTCSGVVEEPGYALAVGESDGRLFVGGVYVAKHASVTKVSLTHGGAVLTSSGGGQVCVWDVLRRCRIHTQEHCDNAVPVTTGPITAPLQQCFALSLLVTAPLQIIDLRAQPPLAPPEGIPVCCSIATAAPPMQFPVGSDPRVSPRRTEAIPLTFVGVRARDGPGGALCVGITEGGPAAEAGLLKGHVVVGVGSTVVTNAADFREAVTGLPEGTPVRVCYTTAATTDVEEAFLTPRVKEVEDVELPQDATECASLPKRFFSRRQSLASSATSSAPPPPPSSTSASSKRSSRARTHSSASRDSSDMSSRSVSPMERSVSAVSTTSTLSKLPPMPPSYPQWTDHELRQLSSSSFEGSTPYSRILGFLKGNNAMVPTPCNEATLRSAATKYILKCRAQKKKYINWWRLTRPPIGI